MSKIKFHIRKYVPTFIDGVPSESNIVDSLKDALELPYVKCWSTDREFSHFTITSTRGGRKMIMAHIHKRGHYVVAFVSVAR